MFTKERAIQNKVIDLSLLPPCQSSLLLHMEMERENYVAVLWKHSMHASIDFPDIWHHGWNVDGTIHWVEKVFPEDFIEIIMDNGDSDDKMYQSENGNDEDLDF